MARNKYHESNQLDLQALALEPESTFDAELFKRWTAAQLRYMMILAKPVKANRCDKEVAKEIGVSRTTLMKWRSLPGFWSQVYEFLKNELGFELTEVWQAIILQAKSGDMTAAKLFLQEVARIEDNKVSDHQAIINILASQGVTINVTDRLPTDNDNITSDKPEAIPDAKEVLSV